MDANLESVHYALGNVDRSDGEYDAAESHFMEAQNLWLKGDQMRSDPFNGSCMYRLGCVALNKGSVEAAVYVFKPLPESYR